MQTLSDTASGFGYVYSKVLKLTPGKPEMVLTHTLKNSGARAIKTSVYNHNFLVLDQRPPGPGVTITVPFQIEPVKLPQGELAEVRGKQIVYLKTLTGKETVAMPLAGFGNSSEDNQIRIENSSAGMGMTIATDRPLLSEALWSIRSVVAMEPFIAIDIEPGGEFTWTTIYNYYALAAAK